MLRRFGPHCAPTFFGGIWWVVKIDFTLCVYAQNAQNFMRNSNVHANEEKKISPLTFPPTPHPPSLGAGTGPLVGNFFFQNPHICVFKMISATRGSC